MIEARPSVPSAVKRQLRQEAGFGCCRCGHPFIQYHHIISWAEEKHFRPSDMMVLCGQCHPLCTVGALTEIDQRALKARPKNIVDNMVRGRLFVNASELSVNLGGGRAIETPNLLVLAGEMVLGATLDKDLGRVLVSANIHDKSGQIIAQLRENEWAIALDDVWDFEASPLSATIRLRPRDIAFSIDARNDQIDVRGKWFHRGLSIEFSPTECRLGTNVLRGFNVSQCSTMIAVG